jgi:16S rRNA (guanine966-N2)-methyltransferase
MRIVGGSARGRALKSPRDESVRPTPDRVRQALFNILGWLVDDAQVLDLFAGSGALGIEALSRGATRCVFTELDAEVISLIKENVEHLGFAAQAEVIRGDAYKIISRLLPFNTQFNLVFVAPPYSQIADAAGRARLMALFAEMAERGLLAGNVMIVIQHDSYYDFLDALPPGFEQTDFRAYGRTRIAFIEKPGQSPKPEARQSRIREV